MKDIPIETVIHVEIQVLANLTCNTQATTSLVLKSGLFSWIEIQLITTCQVTDGVTWVKILDNIMSVVDPHKIEVSTNGEWRSVICRCLSMVLNDDKTCTCTLLCFPLPFANCSECLSKHRWDLTLCCFCYSEAEHVTWTNGARARVAAEWGGELPETHGNDCVDSIIVKAAVISHVEALQTSF